MDYCRVKVYFVQLCNKVVKKGVGDFGVLI